MTVKKNSPSSDSSSPINHKITPTLPTAKHAIMRSKNSSGSRMSKEARKKQLLSVASQVFGELGYHQTGMDDIAIHAGISKPVLYQHFPSKLELYTAVLDTHLHTLVDGLKQALENTVNSKKRVHQAVKAFFEFISEEGQAYKLIFHSDVTDPAIQYKIQKNVDQCVSYVYESIKRDEYLNAEQARMVACALVGLSQKNASYWVESSHNIDREAAISLTTAMAWGAYLHAHENSKKTHTQK